jgi:hypothetical protein
MAKADLLLESLSRFFEQPEHLEKLKDILGHRQGISLRNLEWFVTNYCKDRHVTYQTPAGRQFTVHVDINQAWMDIQKSCLIHFVVRSESSFMVSRRQSVSSIFSSGVFKMELSSI